MFRSVLILITFAAPLTACLWDYDTLAQESRGMPDVRAAIVGGFPRNPPLYYEMRLQRLRSLLVEQPNDLDALDSAAVACDRLGRHDEAIEFMATKLAVMERLGYDGKHQPQPNHRYRYLANLGTFHAHRWFAGGARGDAMEDLLRGRQLIAQAIDENPDAHFGREKLQLGVMDWVISLKSGLKPDATADHNAFVLIGASDRDPRPGRNVSAEVRHAQINGLVGLITMGAAWESVDVLRAMQVLLQGDSRAAFAYLAELRIHELVAQGKRSIGWDPSTSVERHLEEWRTWAVTGRDSIEADYSRLRAAADAWHADRTAYMLGAMNEGRHPDTHEDFWAGFSADPDRWSGADVGALEYMTGSIEGTWNAYKPILLILGGAAALLALYVLLRMRYQRRARARSLPAQGVRHPA